MKISLITATLGRSDSLERLLISLVKQTYKNFELIIVDQNYDNRLFSIINKYSNKIHIKHLTSEKGLSKSRNVGLKHVEGDIIGFPDDDCWYPQNLLMDIKNCFKGKYISGVIVKVLNEKGEVVFPGYNYGKSRKVTLLNVWEIANSNALFFTNKSIESVGFFDENLGVGSGTIYGAAEDIDYPIRAIKGNCIIHFNSEISTFHDKKKQIYNEEEFRKSFMYACGMGYVIKKHNYNMVFKLKILIRPLIGLILSYLLCNKNKAKMHYMKFKGRLSGLNN